MDDFTPPPAGKKAYYSDPNRKPKVLPVNADGIPDELKALPRWVLWKLTWKERKGGAGKWDKVPVSAGGIPVDATSPTHWLPFERVIEAYRIGRFDGVGFALGDGVAGIDADDVRDPTTGELGVAWAAELVTQAGTYADVSPSRTGVKLFGRGVWAGKWHKKPHPSGVGDIEVYDGGRFFTVTGHRQEVVR